ncbi:uncharacterized protein Z520_01674 [Fonsecaea multimorphosa CBS 102226]|uniref:3-oxoacyl-[acyl-carrier protein] reductase n=1 Tax=Fonsecaea multimorphosa CBS 102226 TaxID=1442371 RepID=A0A0D2J1E0_9EURO|nr:uncharacterized protein Z520_01674 [Fonsecaea multimorphosa CBS 102226]KIY03207.1 hypothetical protein Z520_01674 [Fonsecaea multimorphosa CBS 102226]OAL30448.1 hypothetical protein AYO22_01646 [Fonsecaea multimorphosa]
MSLDNRLEGRLALITGASGGIGSACARALWNNGMSLALTYSSNKPSLETLIAELESSNGENSSRRRRQISMHQVRLETDGDISSLFQDIQAIHSHSPDVLIANAGYAKVIPRPEDITIEEFDRTISINLRSTFLLVKDCLPYMIEQSWGRIVFISSIAAEGGGINGCHYAASKAGMNGMMKNLATKLGRGEITVNSLAPAMIGDTGLIPDPKMLEGTPGDVKNIPVGRLGTPQECANVVEMICKTGYLTGQNILLSGGLR